MVWKGVKTQLHKKRVYRTFALFVHIVGVYLHIFCEDIHIFSPFIHILEQRVFYGNTRKRSVYSEVFVVCC